MKDDAMPVDGELCSAIVAALDIATQQGNTLVAALLAHAHAAALCPPETLSTC